MIGIACVCIFLAASTGAQDTGCGVSHDATPITPEHFNTHPHWVVGVEVQGKVGFPCLGNVIAPNLILTSAHCTTISKYKPISVTVPSCGSPETICKYDISKIIAHPAYSVFRPEQDNDIALLVLNGTLPADYSFFCLPTRTYSPDTLVGKNTFVIGKNIHRKGETSKPGTSTNITLEMVVMPVVSTVDCQRELKGKLQPHNSHLCAGGHGVDPCSGDSAAPLIEIGEDKHWTLRAILTLGSVECGNSTVPSVYTNIGAHAEWIRETQASL